MRNYNINLNMFVHIAVLFLSISGSYSLPVEDKDIDILVPEGFEYNSLINGGGEDIDLSSLGPEAYVSPNNNTGDALAEWTESSLMNPEELGSYGQGDIIMPSYLTRNGLKAQSSRWPNGIIPYSIEGRFNQDQKDMIMKGIADFHRLTCLRFVPYNGQSDYIAITSANSGCWSSVGRIGGRQEVNLQSPGCVTKKGTVLHEILHAVGFTHEQSRPERDDYVTVNYNNVRSGSENNFKKSDSKYVSDFGVSYDYNSVMHYSNFAFSKNSQETITPKVGGMKLGQREGFSRGDVKKVNNMYNCNKKEPETGWLSDIWTNLFGGNKTK